MEFTNEYEFDTEWQREYAIWHIANLVAEGYCVTRIEDGEGAKTLVTFEK